MALVEKKTPEAFRKACDKFIYIENLALDEKSVLENKSNENKSIEDKENLRKIKIESSVENKKIAEKDPTTIVDRATLNLIYKAVKDNSDESGWANLSVVGQYISMVKPDFDARNYGRAKLSGLIKVLELFETKFEGSQMYLKKIKR